MLCMVFRYLLFYSKLLQSQIIQICTLFFNDCIFSICGECTTVCFNHLLKDTLHPCMYMCISVCICIYLSDYKFLEMRLMGERQCPCTILMHSAKFPTKKLYQFIHLTLLTRVFTFPTLDTVNLFNLCQSFRQRRNISSPENAYYYF